jgi:hypothetical protein
MVLSPLDNFMHNVISVRNARATATGAAPTGDGNEVELKQNWDIGGHDLYGGSSTAPSVQVCEQRCRQDTSCAAFSYEEMPPNTCFLKSSAARSPVHEHGPSPHHTSGVMQRNGSVLAVGPSGQLQEVPRGHVSTFVVVGVRQQGIHGAMRAWGRAVRQKYNTTRNTAGDVVTNKLGLWTDNGAVGSDGDTAPLLAAQAHGLLQSGVPIRYIQLDPWALNNADWDVRYGNASFCAIYIQK